MFGDIPGGEGVTLPPIGLRRHPLLQFLNTDLTKILLPQELQSVMRTTVAIYLQMINEDKCSEHNFEQNINKKPNGN